MLLRAMATLSRRGASTPVLASAAVIALTPTQLVANFPSVLDTIQCHHLLHPPPTPASASSASTSSTLHTRFLTKCLGLISQGQRASNPPEQWCGLQLLCALVRQSAPASLTPHYQQITATLVELQKQAGRAGEVLDVPLLECMAAVLCSAAEAGGEVRRDMTTTQLNKTVGTVIDRLNELLPPSTSASAPATATTSSSLRRLLVVLEELLSVYAASLRSFSSRLQPLLTSLLLHCDDSCLPPLLRCLTAVLVSATTAAASQQSNKAKQARMQQAAQDTSDEVAQQKLTAATPSSTAANSPYHAFAAACVHEMTAAVDELREAVGEQPLMGSAVRGGVGKKLGWEAVVGEGVARGLEVKRRYERVCAVLAVLVAPQLPPAVSTSWVELSVPLLPLLHVLFGAMGVEPYASSGSSMAESRLTTSTVLFVLPSMYDSSLRLLDLLLQHSRHVMLTFVYPLSSLLVDVHRRCSTDSSLDHLLPAAYSTLASFFHLPLSPSLLSTFIGNFLTLLLSHVQQPFVLRRELTMQQASQSMASQLKSAAARNRRGAATSAASTAASERVGEQQAVREKVAAGALLCLHSMLEAGSLLPLAARTTIDSTLLLLAMSLASSTSTSSLPIPATLRVLLYRCLLAALTHPPAASPSAFTSPLLPYALPVLARGALSVDGEEASLSREGLLLCEWLTRERPGVTIGKRRKADRVFDRAEGEEDEDAHVLDRLDEWRAGIEVAAGGSVAAAAVDGEQSAGKRRRTMDEREGNEQRRRVSALFASTVGSAGEEKHNVQMQQVEHQQDGVAAQSEGEQGWEREQKQATGSETLDVSDEDGAGEEEEQQSEDEQSEDEEVIEEKEQKQSVSDERTMNASTNSFNSEHGDVDDGDEFGAVLHVDDDVEDDG